MKTNKMPATVRMAGRTFKLILADDGFQRETVLGQYEVRPGIIRIRNGMDDDTTKAVVLHELFHDFDYQSCGTLTETQINSVAALTFAALRDNPKLVAWLMS